MIWNLSKEPAQYQLAISLHMQSTELCSLGLFNHPSLVSLDHIPFNLSSICVDIINVLPSTRVVKHKQTTTSSPNISKYYPAEHPLTIAQEVHLRPPPLPLQHENLMLLRTLPRASNHQNLLSNMGSWVICAEWSAIHSWSLTARPWKVTGPQKGRLVFQPSFLRVHVKLRGSIWKQIHTKRKIWD